MNRRIIFIILAALGVALVVGLIWFWFFTGTAETPSDTGTFGTGENRAGTTGTSANRNNIPSGTLPTGTTGTNSGSGVNGSTGGGSNGQTFNVGGVDKVAGVDWLGGTVGGGGGGGATTGFVPSTINQLNDGTTGGTPTLFGSGGTDINDGGNGFGLGGILGAAAGCVALFALSEVTGNADAAVGGAKAIAGGFVLTYDFNAYKQRSQTQFKDIKDCLARTIAKAIIQQITSSIVNWINSGFNGQPSFVTNYNQFFNNVGDQAAGEFIRGTGLAFLCSPFKAQIRIAIAQSYARRNSPSCTLTGIIKNINGFMNGNFSQGGWGGLLQFTSIPTNNPFGAMMYAEAGLQSSINNAQNNARNNLSPGGFISLQKCDPPGSKNCKTSTPGTLIEAAMKKTAVDVPYDSLNLAKSFDEIINALITQLTTRMLYQGLSTLSGSNGYAANYLTPEQQKAQDDARTLLNQLQGYLQTAQQYGSVQQGSISDIQNTQQLLHSLFDCYNNKGNTVEASSTQETIDNYDNSIAAYNANITKANQTIVLLQDLQTETISVASAADVAAVTARFNDALASGALITQAEVTTAQQDRTTLQSYLAGRNNTTQSALQQCNAS